MSRQEAKEKIVCVCLKEFTEKTILIHLNHHSNKTCKEKFDKEKYESLKAEKKELRKQYIKEYNETNAPRLRARKKINYTENPSPAKKRTKNYYAENKERISQKRKESYSQNKESLNKKRRDDYAKNPTPTKDGMNAYYAKNSEKIKKQKKDAIDERSKEARILRFRRAIMEGPIYVCHSCNRALYKNGTQTLKINKIETPNASIKLDDAFLKEIGLFGLDGNKKLTFCHKCLKNIRKKKVPDISTLNGLELDHIPEELKLTDLEQQLIAKTLIFLTIRKLPKSGMKLNTGKLALVPLGSEDVHKTVSQLPRHPDDAQMLIAVQFRRKLEFKHSYLSEYIRPDTILQYLRYLKKIGNFFYQDIDIDKDFLTKEDTPGFIKANDDGSATLEEDNQGTDEAQENEEQETLDDETETRLDAVRKYQSNQNVSTCLIPDELAHKVTVNYKSESVRKNGVAIAPGEGKVATTFLRDKFFDVKSFPKHHPSGKFGIDHSRKYKLSPIWYFNQRLLNADERFQKDPCYVFMASQYVERHKIEQQISLSGVKGPTITTETGEKKVQLSDPFSVFTDVKGTPKYWQKAKNELSAKIAQLGSFHIFYTFSCAEMRWTEVFLTMLRKKGYKIEHPDMNKWDGNDAEILVEGTPLWTYVNKIMGEKQHSLFNEYTFIITRMFNERVKSFVKHILMARGKDKIPLTYFSYRVEFQARGFPHIHGVAWIDTKCLVEDFGIKGDFRDYPRQVEKLTDELISCQIPDDNENLAKIVKEVQKHGHTKSCLKYNGICRYGFPRLPCPKTLIAQPLPPSMDKEAKKEYLEKATKILNKAKAVLDEEDLDENMSFETFYKKIDENLTEEEYLECLRYTEKGTVLFLKRRVKERDINNFNPEMLEAWNANMDLQIALDPYAILMYIVSYVNKDETGTTAFLKEALKANSDKDVKEKLNALKNAYSENREVGYSEAVYRAISDMYLKNSNIGTVFVHSGFPEKRHSKFNWVKNNEDDFENSDDEEEANPTKNPNTVKLHGYDGHFKSSVSVHERYASRPKKLKPMCIAQFATHYKYTTVLPTNEPPVFEEGCSTDVSSWQTIYNKTTHLPNYIELQGELVGYMKLNSRPVVLRYHTASKKNGDREKFARPVSW